MKILVSTDDWSWGISEVVEEDFHHATLALIHSLVSYTSIQNIEVRYVSDDCIVENMGNITASFIKLAYSGPVPQGPLKRLQQSIEELDSFFEDNLNELATDEAFDWEREQKEAA